jgi:tetratricopeptide (TPR) repeat protein
MTAQDTSQPAFDDQQFARLIHDALTLANTWRIRGRWADALTVLRGLAPLVRERGDTLMAHQCVALGHVLTDMATFGGMETRAEREAVLDHALQYAERSGHASLIGAVCAAQGMSLHVVYLESNRSTELAEELSLFERALALRQLSGDHAAIAESLFHVGLVYGVVRNDHARAVPYFEDAYRRATDAQDPITASYAIRHIAFARAAASDLPAALSALHESLRLREAANFIPGVAMTYMTLAYPYLETGDTATAAHCLKRAKAIFESLDAPRRVAEVNHQLAQVR